MSFLPRDRPYIKAAILAWVLFVLFSGCSSLRERSPKLVIKSPDKSRVELEGNAEVPATVNQSHTAREIPLPKNTTIERSAEGAEKITIPEASMLSENVSAAHIIGPRAFDGPSPSDVARGQGLRLFYIGGVVLGVLAALAGWRGHLKAAALFAVGAIAMPIIGNIASSTAALWIGSISLVAGGTLFAGWHLLRDKHPEIDESSPQSSRVA